MDYVIDKNAKNLWIRDNDDTMDLSPETDAGTVYLTNGRTLEQELGEGSMVSNVVTVNTSMSKVIDGTYDGAYESCIFKGQTKWIDNDTGEILDSFVANRNLSLIDVKMPVVKNVGKNLFDVNDVFELGYIDENGYVTLTDRSNNFIRKNNGFSVHVSASYGGVVSPYIKVKGSTDYRFGYKQIGLFASQNNFVFYDLNKNPIGFLRDKSLDEPLTTHLSCAYMRVGFWHWLSDSNSGKNICYEDIQLEEVTTQTPYQPYKSNTLTTTEEITLRSLPNGVQDTYNPLTGEYVRRIGTRTFNGSEIYNSWGKTGTTGMIGIYSYVVKSEIKPGENQDGFLCCDSLPVQHRNLLEQINFDAVIKGTDYIGFVMKDKTEDEIKAWLKANPVTVHYELATPIITKVDPKGHPFAYENGHVILESGHQGQSLLPIMDYSTVINRTGQIKSIGEQSLRQDKQINKLEQMLVSNIIAMNYNNTLLKLNLTMNEVK